MLRLCFCVFQCLTESANVFHACTSCLFAHAWAYARAFEPCIILHPSAQTSGRGRARFKCIRVCVCLWFRNGEGSTVFWLPACSVVFVPLNKHVCRDESHSVSSPWPYGRAWLVVRHSVTINHCLLPPQHPPVGQSTCVHTSHPQLHTHLPPHTNRQFMGDVPTAVISDCCLLTQRNSCTFAVGTLGTSTFYSED